MGRPIFAILLLLAAVAGCGREYAWEKEQAAPRAKEEGAAADLERRAEALWARRDDPAALREAIALEKRVLDAKGGKDYATLVRLSRAHYLLGELEAENEKKLEAYDAGVNYGDLALHALPAFREAFAKSGAIEDAVGAVGREGIEAIYWDAVNRGKWARAKDLAKAMFMKNKVRKMVERVATIDERWFYGAADRYLGAYFAALPTIGGRDLEESRKHFEKAKAAEPRYLATHTLIAEYLAQNSNDRKLFRSELELVLATPAEALPDVAPEQRIEQRKARKLLDEIDDRFEAEAEGEAPAPAAPGGKG